MLIKGYSGFKTMIPDPVRRASSTLPDGARIWAAAFNLDADISHLFPYINAVIDDALYYESPHYVQFAFHEYPCALYPRNVQAGYFEDREAALEFVEKLIDFLNDLDARRDSLKPNHEKFKPVSALEIFKTLPKTNCQECGFLTCMAFAVELSGGRTVPEQCTGFINPLSESAVYPVLDDQGNMVSTVEIKIDTSKMRDDLDQKKTDIKILKESVARLAQEKEKSPSDDESTTAFGLTGREIEVLRLMAEGMTNTEISNSLFVSPHTVKSHVIHIFNKLCVNDRTHAAVLAIRHRII